MTSAAFHAPQSPPEALPSPSPQRPAGRRKPRRRKALREAAGGASPCPPHVRVDELNIGFDPANLRRCGGCGGMVYLWPCLACRGRKRA